MIISKNKPILLLSILLIFTMACSCGLIDRITGLVRPKDAIDGTVPLVVLEEPAEEEATPVELGEEFRSEEGGFAFRVIPEYQVVDFLGIVSMESPQADPESGPAIFFIGGINEQDMTLDDLYQQELAEFDTDTLTLGEVQDVRIDRKPARQVALSGKAEDGTPITGRLLVVAVSPTQYVTMFAYAPQEQWDDLVPTIDTVAQSLTFFTPMALSFEIEEPEPPLEEVNVGEALLRQWATGAIASSIYTEDGDPWYYPEQATGAPDSFNCDSEGTAWSPEGQGTEEWLEVYFQTPVVTKEINIHQVYTPGAIVSVRVIDKDWVYYPVYSAQPQMSDECPQVLSIPVSGIDVEVIGVEIYFDQTKDPDFWVEVDAVELVGYAAGSTGTQGKYPFPLPDDDWFGYYDSWVPGGLTDGNILVVYREATDYQNKVMSDIIGMEFYDPILIGYANATQLILVVMEDGDLITPQMYLYFPTDLKTGEYTIVPMDEFDVSTPSMAVYTDRYDLLAQDGMMEVVVNGDRVNIKMLVLLSNPEYQGAEAIFFINLKNLELP